MRSNKSIYNHEYAYYLYTLNLNSLIGKLKSVRYNPLKANGSDVLDEVCAYIKTYYRDESISKDHMNEIGKLFKEATEAYIPSYKKWSLGYFPGAIDSYLEAISLLGFYN